MRIVSYISRGCMCKKSGDLPGLKVDSCDFDRRCCRHGGGRDQSNDELRVHVGCCGYED